MYLEDIKLSEHVVETADAVVAIDANDLPAPGDGFATFFQRLTQSGRALDHERPSTLAWSGPTATVRTAEWLTIRALGHRTFRGLFGACRGEAPVGKRP